MKQGVRDPGSSLQARGHGVRRQGRERGAEGGRTGRHALDRAGVLASQGEPGYRPELWTEREAYSTGMTKES